MSLKEHKHTFKQHTEKVLVTTGTKQSIDYLKQWKCIKPGCTALLTYDLVREVK